MIPFCALLLGWNFDIILEMYVTYKSTIVCQLYQHGLLTMRSLNRKNAKFTSIQYLIKNTCNNDKNTGLDSKDQDNKMTA